MHKKVGLALAIFAVILVSVACSSNSSAKYQPPQTKDAFEKPYIDGSAIADTTDGEDDTDFCSAADAPRSVGDDPKEETSCLAASDQAIDDAAADELDENETKSVDEVDSLVSGVDEEVSAGVDGTSTEQSGSPEADSAKATEDTKLSDTETFTTLNVSEPVDIPTIVVNEGELVKVRVKARDADGDTLAIIFGPPLNSKGEWQTRKGDAGTKYPFVRVSDGKTTTTGRVKIVVKLVNNPPVLKHMYDLTVNEGDTVNLPIEASDPDGDKLQTTIEGWMTSATKLTAYKDAGTYEVTVSVSDGKATTSQTVKITVKDMNRAPVIEGIFGSKV